MVVSTGRAHFELVSIFEALGIKTSLITPNAPLIHHPHPSLYHHQTIHTQPAYHILSSLHSQNYYYQLFTPS
ncbi:HAD family hydrolase, partial [Bacillus subtilis]|uniref:HAD family hydrolase n=1 Tax=Bacillus subtilis TaxID=1423 RepID=UPI003F4D6C79